MKEELKKKLINSILERVPNYHCPICGSHSFSIVDGFAQVQLQNELSRTVVLGGQVIPTFMIVCNNCGFISHHAVGIIKPELFKELKEEK